MSEKILEEVLQQAIPTEHIPYLQNFIKKHKTISLIVAALAAIYFYFSSLISPVIKAGEDYRQKAYVNQQIIADDFKTQDNEIRDVANAMENLYTDSRDGASSKIITADITILKTQLEILTKQESNMGGLISLPAYCADHQFTYFANQLQQAGPKGAGSFILNGWPKVGKFEDNALEHVHSDESNHIGNFWTPIKDYASNMSVRNKQYYPLDCITAY